MDAMLLTRRDLLTGNTAEAQAPTLTESKVYRFDELPVRRMANGGESRDILHGTLATGEVVALHCSMQPAGLKPNPQHRIEHTEFIFVREGTMEFLHGDQMHRVNAGDIIFVSYGTMHTARNAGEGPASYSIIAIGGDVKA